MTPGTQSATHERFVLRVDMLQAIKLGMRGSKVGAALAGNWGAGVGVGALGRGS